MNIEIKDRRPILNDPDQRNIYYLWIDNKQIAGSRNKEDLIYVAKHLLESYLKGDYTTTKYGPPVRWDGENTVPVWI